MQPKNGCYIYTGCGHGYTCKQIGEGISVEVTKGYSFRSLTVQVQERDLPAALRKKALLFI